MGKHDGHQVFRYREFALSRSRPFDGGYFVHPYATLPSISIHDGFEVGIMLKGLQEIIIEDVRFTFGPGSVWLIDRWEPHQWRILEPDTRKVLLMFLPNFLGDSILPGANWQDIFRLPVRERPALHDENLRNIALDIGHDMMYEIDRKPPAWEAALRLHTARILLTINRNSSLPSTREQIAQNPSKVINRIMPAISAVHANPSNRIPLPEAAAACGLSVAQFSRLFKQALGVTYSYFHLRAHLAVAARLLLSSELPLETIANRSGFVDASHLHRNFVRFYHISPGAYRIDSQEPVIGVSYQDSIYLSQQSSGYLSHINRPAD